MKNVLVELSSSNLSLEKAASFVTNEECGGMVHFVGSVRNQTKGSKVLKLDFEAYEPMAISEMRKIAIAAQEKYGIQKVAILHRTGTLFPTDAAVIIAVSSPHREAAFKACSFCIDTLKESVPIWKKEYFENGEVWVSATP